MLRLRRSSLDLLERAGELGDGNAAFFQAAAATARLVAARALLLVAGKELRNSQLLLFSHVLLNQFFLRVCGETFVETSQDNTLAQSPGTNLQLFQA